MLEFDINTVFIEGTKRRYEQSGDHKKSYGQVSVCFLYYFFSLLKSKFMSYLICVFQHSHNQEPQRKYQRSDGSHSFEVSEISYCY